MKDLRLRAIEPRDLPYILKWENDESAWDYSDTIAPLSEKIIADYISEYNADPFISGQLRLMVIDSTDTPLGMVDLYKIEAIHSHACVGIYIAPAHRNSGVGELALRLLHSYALNRLGLRRLAAFILPENKVSLYLFHKIGYVKCGCLPQWRRIGASFRDLEIYVRILE